MCNVYSIVYAHTAFNGVCTAKNGTYGTLQLLLNQHVDVIFGPICSAGGLKLATYGKQHY